MVTDKATKQTGSKNISKIASSYLEHSPSYKERVFQTVS